MGDLGTVLVCSILAFAVGAILDSTGFFSWLWKFFPWTKGK